MPLSRSPLSPRRRRPTVRTAISSALVSVATTVATLISLIAVPAAADPPTDTAGRAPGPAITTSARTVRVTDAPYGAHGDGEHNDRAAIQQAIDDMSRSGGGTVQLPAGHTYLSGNLSLQDNVAFDVEGTLTQSQNADDYTFAPLLGHTAPNGNGTAWYSTWFFNYPFIFAGHKKNVAVTGSGTLQMTQNHAGDDATIHLIAIGFYDVQQFLINGLHINDNNCYNVTVWESQHGVISNLDINATTQPNTDGINVKNSQHIRITGNEIDNRDDGIIVGAGYDDPRVSTWWQSHPLHGGSQDIEIDHNVDRLQPVNPNPVGKAIAFIPWGTLAPDPRTVEISDIDIHDNYLQAPQSVGCWCDNPYKDGSTGNQDGYADHSPMKNVRIVDNTYRSYDGASPSAMSWIQYAKFTNLVDDFGKLSSPQFLNPGFEQDGDVFWTTAGDAGADTADASALHDPAARAAAQHFPAGQSYGYVQGAGLNNAKLYEGLGLNDGLRYRFTAKVVTGGHPVKLFAVNSCTGSTVGERTLTNTTPQTVTLDFTAAGTCGSYHVGIERTSVKRAWALIDSADLTPREQIIDNEDPQATYSGSWQIIGNGHNTWQVYPGVIGGGFRWGTAAGTAVTVAFSGTRAWLYVVKRSDAGTADVYVDGRYAATIDLYNQAWVDHQVGYDTGELTAGQHTITMVTTGNKAPAATGFRTTFDALAVQQ